MREPSLWPDRIIATLGAAVVLGLPVLVLVLH
jgi:hypothetical protein